MDRLILRVHLSRLRRLILILLCPEDFLLFAGMTAQPNFPLELFSDDMVVVKVATLESALGA